MTRRMARKAAAGAGMLLLAALSLLALAPAASAVQTDIYDPFTACPTDHPALNDPANGFAICAAGSGAGALTIGDETLQLQRVGVQFASTGNGTFDPDCPQEGACFGQVPGTTVVEDDPSPFWVGPPGNPRSNPGKGKALRLMVTLEAAGDVSAFNGGFLFGAPLPIYNLPLKLHVEAPWLGDDCYIGSDENPVVFGPLALGPPEDFAFMQDPNGFQVELVKLLGLPLGDKDLALPRADDCGHGGARSDAKVEARVDELLDLPSPAGSNQLVFPAADLILVGGGYLEGVTPAGAAALQAAFDAAK
jgi:hypothetical protein